MTVLGIVNEKSDDKEQLVGKDDVATIMPNRHRLVKLQKRRSLVTLVLTMGFILIFLCGIFLTVCFIKRIGPFKRHYLGRCPVGSKRFNGHSKIFESYEITDKYALIHVPRFNFRSRTFNSVRTLHVFDSKITVIQHDGMCFVKPMMKYQILRNDWFDKLKMLSHHNFHAPHRFAHYHLRIIHPQLPGNYLRDKVHHMADAMCHSLPVFRLEFSTKPVYYPWLYSCKNKCKNCPLSDQINTVKIVGDRKCTVCECKERQMAPMDKKAMMESSNKMDVNCKTIRCENRCVFKKRMNCVQCRCVDDIEDKGSRKNQTRLEPLVVHDNSIKDTTAPSEKMTQKRNDVHSDTKGSVSTEQTLIRERLRFEPVFDYDGHHRSKRSVNGKCKLVAKIFEGYTPLNYEMRAPIDYIHDC